MSVSFIISCSSTNRSSRHQTIHQKRGCLWCQKWPGWTKSQYRSLVHLLCEPRVLTWTQPPPSSIKYSCSFNERSENAVRRVFRSFAWTDGSRSVIKEEARPLKNPSTIKLALPEWHVAWRRSIDILPCSGCVKRELVRRYQITGPYSLCSLVSLNGDGLFKVSNEYGRLLQAAKNGPGNTWDEWSLKQGS